MNFDLNDEQQEIKRTAHEFLASRFKPEKVRELAESRSYDDGLWKEISELGWPGIAISEERRRPGARNGRARRAARGVRLHLRAEPAARHRRCGAGDLGRRLRRAARRVAAEACLRRGDWLVRRLRRRPEHPLLRPADRRRGRHLRRRRRAARAGLRGRLRALRGDRRDPLLRADLRARRRAAAR